MELTIKNNREITPQKIAVKQYEADTTVLTFTRESYKYDQIDLRNYKAYAVTSLNGEIDMTELTMTVHGSQLVLAWPLSARTLQHAGAIAYQIAFKADADSAAVFSTYQAIIQNSASIDESELVGDYPTIMKQWLDLINARSGVIPHKVVYMLPGNPVPLNKRTAGTLYYQWDEAHTTLATAATGTVNLGSSPYADSGLYINGTHVYVDDTSDTVFVLEPSLWVDAINNANVGVTASDVSTGDNVKILLTASTVGAAGNAITYDLALAQYGAGKGLNNPSGGTTQGSTLTGGYDAQDGVEKPIGQFEDHFGNVLARTGAKLVPGANLDELLEDGEYICSGSFTSPITCSYCMVRVTDSPSTSRIIQECYVVDLSDHTVRTFVRSISGSTFGEWREFAGAEELDALRDELTSEMKALEASVQTSISTVVGFPDWSKSTSILTSAGSSYTAPSNGYLAIVCNDTTKKFTGTIGGFAIRIGSQVTDYHKFMSAVFPVAKGTVIKCTELGCTSAHNPCAYFLPIK